MNAPIFGIKASILNAAAGVASAVPAAAVIQVSETVAQAQETDHVMILISLGLGILSSIVALAWNGMSWWIWWRARNKGRDPK